MNTIRSGYEFFEKGMEENEHKRQKLWLENPENKGKMDQLLRATIQVSKDVDELDDQDSSDELHLLPKEERHSQNADEQDVIPTGRETPSRLGAASPGPDSRKRKGVIDFIKDKNKRHVTFR